MPTFHPGLGPARFIPRLSFGPRSVELIQSRKRSTAVPTFPGVVIEEKIVHGAWSTPEVGLRLYRPVLSQPEHPALFWMHGGGYIIGRPDQDDATLVEMVRTLGITVVAVRYRLAPRNPAPAALDDAYSGLSWLFAHAAELGVDPTRIAIGGASAGAGLAAALAQLTYDRAEFVPAFQLLIYPMLDDRTITRTDHVTRNVRVWEPGSNRFAWTSYLGQEPGCATAPEYVVPARREDLSGLPPAWIGVGTLDLFHDEDVIYARRLREAGVPCELVIIDGAFHGFEGIFPRADISRSFIIERMRALGRALYPAESRL